MAHDRLDEIGGRTAVRQRHYGWRGAGGLPGVRLVTGGRPLRQRRPQEDPPTGVSMAGRDPLLALPHDGSDRGPIRDALDRAQEEVHGPRSYVGQRGFVTTAQLLDLATAAGAAPGARVLDLRCDRGGPALYIARETGCRVVGLDRSPGAARAEAHRRGLSDLADFVPGDAPATTFESGSFDAGLLLEAASDFEDKGTLLREVRRLLRPGGRFALTLEAGEPLSPGERRAMPGGETVWPIPEGEFLALLESSGLRVVRKEEHTASHARVAALLCEALRRVQTDLPPTRTRGVEREILAREWWAGWLLQRRVRKLAVVAERPADDA